MEGSAYCYGAATIINGIATGKGAAFGIGLMTTAKVKLLNEARVFEVNIESDEKENPKLAECCVTEVLRKFGLEAETGAKVWTSSDIPISRGLKSSSAAANAIVLATFNALDKEFNDMEVINLGVDAALKAKVSITGAFDDSCATYFGNAVVTDNQKRKILTQYPIKEDYDVIIHVPEEKIKKIDVDTEKLKGLKDDIDTAHDLALKEDYLTAIKINGLTYGTAMGLNTEISTKAIAAGAATAGISGTGPATVILTKPENKEKVIEAIGFSDPIIYTTINKKIAGIQG